MSFQFWVLHYAFFPKLILETFTDTTSLTKFLGFQFSVSRSVFFCVAVDRSNQEDNRSNSKKLQKGIVLLINIIY